MSIPVFMPEPHWKIFDVERCEGIYLIDRKGQKFIDITGGYCVNGGGFMPEDLRKKVARFIERKIFVSVYGEFLLEEQKMLAERLLRLCGGEWNSVFFTVSGTEAVECAIKCARKYTGRWKVVSFERSYHGSTLLSMGAGGTIQWRLPWGPYPPYTVQIKFNNFDDLVHIDKKTACVIVEPIQGEAGVIIPQENFLKVVEEKCRQWGALLICDEVQTGFWRTGTTFAFQKWEIKPDMIVVGKVIGGGFPLGAVVGKEELFKVFYEGEGYGHISTFGGHPVSCFAGNLYLEWLESIEPATTAKEMESTFKHTMEMYGYETTRWRVAGAMGALDVEEPTAQKVIDYLFNEKHVITGTFLFKRNAIRIYPPLAMDNREFGHLLKIILEAISECAN